MSWVERVSMIASTITPDVERLAQINALRDSLDEGDLPVLLPVFIPSLGGIDDTRAWYRAMLDKYAATCLVGQRMTFRYLHGTNNSIRTLTLEQPRHDTSDGAPVITGQWRDFSGLTFPVTISTSAVISSTVEASSDE